jgi:hypothetical protein
VGPREGPRSYRQCPGSPRHAAIWRSCASKESALVKWFQARTPTGQARGLKAHDGRMATRKTMILALARKLLIALWRLTTTGEVSEGIVLRPAA